MLCNNSEDVSSFKASPTLLLPFFLFSSSAKLCEAADYLPTVRKYLRTPLRLKWFIIDFIAQN